MEILVYGDSNTYGYIPGGFGRYDENTRWTRLLDKKLGDSYRVIDEGLCGRTTVFDDEIRTGRRGIDNLGVVLESHRPVSLVTIMLGTNDCKARFNNSAGTIARGLERLIILTRQVTGNNQRILIISPIHLGEGVGHPGFDPEFDDNSVEVSKGLADAYRDLAERYGCLFLDAAQVAEPSVVDREHLTEEGHAALADAVYEIVKNLD